LPTDWHGLMGEVVSGWLCYGFQVLGCRVIQQEEKERGSRLIGDWIGEGWLVYRAHYSYILNRWNIT